MVARYVQYKPIQKNGRLLCPRRLSSSLPRLKGTYYKVRIAAGSDRVPIIHLASSGHFPHRRDAPQTQCSRDAFRTRTSLFISRRSYGQQATDSPGTRSARLHGEPKPTAQQPRRILHPQQQPRTPRQPPSAHMAAHANSEIKSAGSALTPTGVAGGPTVGTGRPTDAAQASVWAACEQWPLAHPSYFCSCRYCHYDHWRRNCSKRAACGTRASGCRTTGARTGAQHAGQC